MFPATLLECGGGCVGGVGVWVGWGCGVGGQPSKLHRVCLMVCCGGAEWSEPADPDKSGELIQIYYVLKTIRQHKLSHALFLFIYLSKSD